jgi:MFS family permease
MTVYRNVAALIFAVMLLQSAAGILSVSTPLALDSMHASAFGVGVVAAVFSAGFMAGAWFAPDAVRQVGHIRAYSAAAGIYAAGILGMALEFHPVAWGFLRFAQGCASAVMFTSAESWIADSTPRQQRGSVFGLYQFLLKVAMSCGPLLIVDHAPDDIKPFVLAGLLMALATAPICMTRRAQPVLPDREALSVKAMLRIPTSALVGAIVAGVANQGAIAQLPLYAKQLQPNGASAAAATLAIAAWMGGTVTQWPAGLISDKIDRRFVVAALAAIALSASIALFMTSGKVSFSVTIALSALWGAGAMSFYSVSASHATDRSEPGQIAAVMSGMLFVWAGGSVIGPIIAGLTADTELGQPGVFAVMSFFYLMLLLANLWRLLVRPTPIRRWRFMTAGQTSLASAEAAASSERPITPEPSGEAKAV